MTKRVGVIGAGSIVPFHIDALKAAGFEVDSIASRAGSQKAADLNERYQPLARVNEARDVIDRNPDALLIASDVSSLPEFLYLALKGDSKILIEKPVSVSSDDIRRLVGIRDEDVLVGYNRRFYSSVEAATAFVSSNAPVAFQATIAEASSNASLTKEQKEKLLLANSAHVLDLVQAIFGRISNVANIVGQETAQGIVSRFVNVVSSQGHCGNIALYFGAPANYGIDIFAQGRFAQLRPIENFVEFDSISVHEPSAQVPIRTYKPAAAQPEFRISQSDIDYKPGFLKQATALYQMTNGMPVSQLPAGAALADALSVIELAERLIKFN
jgi:predicted dehydrogenase